MIRTLLPLTLAALAGAGIVVQQILNANLRRSLDSAAWSGFASFFIGTACMVLLALALRDPVPSAELAARTPWWAWIGGVFGATFIALSIYLVPQLGAAAFVAALIAGQMVAAVTIDHFGWLGLAQRHLDLPRLTGLALLFTGVLLIRR